MHTRVDGHASRWTAIGCGMAVFAMCAAVGFAQGPVGGGGAGGVGSRLSPEEEASAWTSQAKSVATELGLADDVSAKLVDAYKAARQSQIDAIKAKLGEAGQAGPGSFNAMREVTDAERGKFETAIKAFLNEEQTGKAMGTLGAFNRRWDAMTMVLSGFNLDDAKNAEAMKLVMGYVADSDKAMREAFAAGPGGDRGAMRDKMRAMKQKLDADLGKVLSAEQLQTWTNKTTMRGGGRERRNDVPVPGAAPVPAPK